MSENLYVLAKELEDIMILMENGEGDTAELMERFNTVCPKIQDKAATYAQRMKTLEADVDTCTMEIARLRKRRDVVKGKRDRLRDGALDIMLNLDISRAGTEVHGLTVVDRNGEKFLRVR